MGGKRKGEKGGKGRAPHLSSLNKPMHSLNHIGPRGLLPRVPRIVRQDDNVVLLVAVSSRDEAFDVVDVVDAASELGRLAKVVDSDQERLAFSCA